jgi:hypothetical protein
MPAETCGTVLRISARRRRERAAHQVHLSKTGTTNQRLLRLRGWLATHAHLHTSRESLPASPDMRRQATCRPLRQQPAQGPSRHDACRNISDTMSQTALRSEGPFPNGAQWRTPTSATHLVHILATGIYLPGYEPNRGQKQVPLIWKFCQHKQGTSCLILWSCRWPSTRGPARIATSVSP